METTFDLPQSLLRKAKALAAEQGRPLRDVVAEAIGEKLERGPSGARSVPGYREGRRQTWEEWRAKLVREPDGSWYNPDGIDDESFFAMLEALRGEHGERRDPFEGEG